MQISFKVHNGLCPYFIYENYKFFIQDSKESNGEYIYTLYLKHMKEKTEEYEDEKAVRDYVNSIKGIKHVYSSMDASLYTNILSYYVIKGNKVTIRPTERQLSGSFERYIDCLEFAKKYVIDFIRLQEPEQIKIAI